MLPAIPFTQTLSRCMGRGHGGHPFGDMVDAFSSCDLDEIYGCDMVIGEEDAEAAALAMSAFALFAAQARATALNSVYA